MKYKVELNNEPTFESNSITDCVKECLKYIGQSFKAFNHDNYVIICRGNKIVWNSRLTFNN